MYFIKPNLSSILSFQQAISINIRSEMVGILLHTPCLQSLLQFLHVQCLVFLENTSHVFSFCKICSWKSRWIFSSCSQHTYKFSSDRIKYLFFQFSSVQLLSCVWLCDPMNHSTPGLPVHHQLPEFTQTPVHQVNYAIQPSHPLSSPSPPAPNPSQHQGIFQWVNFFTSGGQSIGVSASASVLPMNIQDWFPLGWAGWISLQSKGLLRVFSNTTVKKHQFFGAQLSL